MSQAAAPPVEDLIYPESDGKPLGETGFHVDATHYLISAAKVRYAGAKDVFFASNMFLYYEEGNPRANVAPDFMVVKGVSGKQRRTFKVWEEGGAIPCVVVEITSKKTRGEDLNDKFALYARLGVAEYYLFDPLGEYLDPRFRGYRLVNGVYERMTPDADGGLSCVELGVRFVPQGGVLRVYDAETGRLYRTADEASALLEEESRAKVRERKRADREARRATKEAKRAEAEAKRADELAAEVERLREMLERPEAGRED